MSSTVSVSIGPVMARKTTLCPRPSKGSACLEGDCQKGTSRKAEEHLPNQ
jgi:hypothetical protein